MGRYATAARQARKLTNKQLATEIAALTRNFNRDSVRELLPKKQDKQVFLELMKQVEADKNMDENIAYLRDNLASTGKVVFKLLKYLV